MFTDWIIASTRTTFGLFASNVWTYRVNDFQLLENYRPEIGPHSGSPSLRSWHPFHLSPQSSYISEEALCAKCAHFRLLTNAIAESRRCLRAFSTDHSLDGGVPPSALFKSRRLDVDINHATIALSNLQHFHFFITRTRIDGPRDAADTMALPQFLCRMPYLKTLKIIFNDSERMQPSPYYIFPQILPMKMMWAYLTNLDLDSFATSAFGFVRLLIGTPNLKLLGLVSIDLFSGCWEGLKLLLRAKHLQDFGFEDDFTPHGGIKFAEYTEEDDDDDDDNDENDDDEYHEPTPTSLRYKIELWVVEGGTHPCLTPDSHPDTERRWLTELFSKEEIRDLKLLAGELGTTWNLPDV